MAHHPRPTGTLGADARPLLRAVAAAAGTVLTLGACAALPSAGQLPAKAPIQALNVEGARGNVSPLAAARQVAAEGLGARARRHLEVMAGLDGGTLYRGNTAQLLVDGPATFAAMKREIAAARQSVRLQSYIVEDDGVAAEIADLLVERAAAGVRVALLYDAVGSLGTPGPFFDRLRQRGVAVCAFNPLTPQGRNSLWDISERDHRKLLVVDDQVAFTGGINISRVYGSGSFSMRRANAKADPLEDGWRDTQIMMRGPVAPALAQKFRDSWHDQQCEGTVPDVAPPMKGAEPGRRHIKILYSDPSQAGNPIYNHLVAAIGAATHEVLLTMAYFAPGRDTVAALVAAARRGVRVALVLPGRSDFALVLHAGRSYYDELLEAGVEIHEMRDAMMHAKTAVIDGVWSTVGLSNLDWRSLADNHELNVVIVGEDFAAELRQLFERDREVSERVNPAQWARRGLQPRLWESLGRIVERWL